jgi:hypothetical protein
MCSPFAPVALDPTQALAYTGKEAWRVSCISAMSTENPFFSTRMNLQPAVVANPTEVVPSFLRRADEVTE